MAANIKLAEADPCRILSDNETAHLGVGRGTLVTSSEAMGGRGCRMTNFPDKPDTTPGKTYLTQLLDNPGKLTPDAGAVPPIEQLPTTRGTPSGSTADNSCVYVVDLTGPSTPSRYLWVQYTNVARDNPAMNHQLACHNALAAADAAIKSLNQTS